MHCIAMAYTMNSVLRILTSENIYFDEYDLNPLKLFRIRIITKIGNLYFTVVLTSERLSYDRSVVIYSFLQRIKQ